MARTQTPVSAAVTLLRQRGGVTLDRLAELAETTTPSVSRQLSGIQPLGPEVKVALRFACGAEVGSQIIELAEEARSEHLRERRAARVSRGEAG